LAELCLSGLRSSVPLGFMAAIGAFRHASSMPELGEVKLKWTRFRGDWRAALVTTVECATNQLVNLFVERVTALGHRPEFSWADQVKKNTVEEFRKHAAGKPELQDWFAAFASELDTAKDGTLRSTFFDMTGGQQEFLQKLLDASQLMSSDQKEAEELFREALFGPWQYRSAAKQCGIESSHSLGLDPSTVLQGALTGSESAKTSDKRGIRGAIWLAFEGIPYFPCVHDQGLATAGFVREGKSVYFEWPIWEQALSARAVRTLLVHPHEGNLTARGCVARYRSERVNLIKDYYSLSASELL
jgi:hypothetical protein